jgi:hypothetical protein
MRRDGASAQDLNDWIVGYREPTKRRIEAVPLGAIALP